MTTLLLVITALCCMALTVRGQNGTFNAGAYQEYCQDYNEVNNPECWEAMVWAKTTGRFQHPEWYPAGMATYVDIQCAIALKGSKKLDGKSWVTGKVQSGSSHNCGRVPCSYVSNTLSLYGGTPDQAQTSQCHRPTTTTSSTLAAVTIPPTTPTTTTTTTVAPSSLPIWAAALLAALLVAGVVLASFLLTRKKVPAKKRAVKPAPAPLPVETEPLPTYAPVHTYIGADQQPHVYEPVQTRQAMPTWHGLHGTEGAPTVSVPMPYR